MKFAEGKSKRYSKKEDLLYGTIQLFFHYKTYNGGFFKNKKYVGNNKWTVCDKGGKGGLNTLIILNYVFCAIFSHPPW